MLTRYQDWPERLDEYLNSRLAVPFTFGVNDCALFAMDAIQAMTGVDLGAEIRGTYSDQEGANAILTEENLLRIATAAGMEEKPILFAQRGDILLYMQQSGPTLLVLGMDGINGWGPGEDGAKQCAPARNCLKAWRV